MPLESQQFAQCFKIFRVKVHAESATSNNLTIGLQLLPRVEEARTNRAMLQSMILPISSWERP